MTQQSRVQRLNENMTAQHVGYSTAVNSHNSGYVRTGEFDLNTLRDDGEIFESGKKSSLICSLLDQDGWILMLI